MFSDLIGSRFTAPVFYWSFIESIIPVTVLDEYSTSLPGLDKRMYPQRDGMHNAVTSTTVVPSTIFCLQYFSAVTVNHLQSREYIITVTLSHSIPFSCTSHIVLHFLTASYNHLYRSTEPKCVSNFLLAAVSYEIGFPSHSRLYRVDSYFSVLRIRILDPGSMFFSPWIRDEKKNPDLGLTSRIIFPRA
jgi:hypothetical protein